MRQLGGILHLGGDRLVQRRLIRPGVDLRQQISRPDRLALDESQLHQFPVHAGSDRHRVKSLDRTQAVEKDGYIASRRRGGLDVRTTWGKAGEPEADRRGESTAP